MANYKLIYFNGKGLAELSRFIFVVSGTEFEDFRFEPADWPKYKGDTIFGQVPILEVNENGTVVKLAQSNTIARFLARRFNLAGKTDIEQAKAEMIIDHFVDLQGFFRQAYTEQNEEVKLEKFKKFAEDHLPHHIGLLEKILEQQKTQYLVSDELTVADLSLAVNLDRHQTHLGNTLDRFPLVKAVNDRVNSNPKLAAYLTNRPVTNF